MKNWRKWKDAFFLVPAVVIAVGTVAGSQGNVPVVPEIPITWDQVAGGDGKNAAEKIVQAAERAREKNPAGEKTDKTKKRKYKKYKKKSRWKDGTYTGCGTGYGGVIRVQVMIRKEKIMEIKILSHVNETPAYFSKARAVAERIVSAQNPNVDVISGATFSSGGIMEAVIDALKKAGDDSLAVAKKTITKVEKTSVTKNEDRTKNKLKGQPADGVFSGSAVCERFGYTVHLKVKFRQGKTAALYGLRITGNSDPANESFWKKAWRPVIRDILKRQKADVDAVSGATYSSNAIMDAYADACIKAVKENDPDNDQIVLPTKKPKPTKQPEPTGRPAMPAENRDEAVPDGEIQDGIYHVSAVCQPDEGEDFESYNLSADVSFQNGKCTAIMNLSSTAESNRFFYKKAAEGTKNEAGVVEQIIGKQSADGISAVTGATCSSKTIRELYLLALAKASAVPEQTSAAAGEETSVPEESSGELTGETTAPEPEESGCLKDGSYTLSVTVFPDEGEDFYEYSLEADAVVSGGIFTGFENIRVQDSVNLWYCNRALLGTGDRLGILEQLVQKQSADSVDAVTGATCSSDAWLTMFREMYQLASVPGGDTQE